MVESVPQMMFGADGMIVPSWARGRRRPLVRWGASRPASRMILSTRLRPTRMPCSRRRRAVTLRWPSPENGEDRMTSRILASSSSSVSSVRGPRLSGITGHNVLAALAYTVEREHRAHGTPWRGALRSRPSPRPPPPGIWSPLFRVLLTFPILLSASSRRGTAADTLHAAGPRVFHEDREYLPSDVAL